VEPTPDSRWQIIVAGVTADGRPIPMSFEFLHSTADTWARLVPTVDEPFDGPLCLLRMSRSLFAHAWFDYEFMVVASTVAFQALEAALRLIYPGEEKVPARALLKRLKLADSLPKNILALVDSGFELRNLLSHPATQSAFTLPMAISIIENSHRLVALLVTMAINGDGKVATQA
jgi:hypothetical protein